ncbi:MAG: hypothetical protein QOG64_1607 [Acidimicrobiaceae bacterium]|jgi:hypothetical protein|nr:hypothetical protein [Acidimicrobiaceae bacterium]
MPEAGLERDADWQLGHDPAVPDALLLRDVTSRDGREAAIRDLLWFELEL